MKTVAAVLRSGSSPLTFDELDIGPLRPDEVLVRIAGAGICHTDLGVIANPADAQMPIVLGHEGSGVIEQVGSAVTTLRPGDHVVLSYASDGACDNCRQRLPMHCRQFLGLNMTGARLDGTSPLSQAGEPVLGAWFAQSSWATHSVATERNCVKVNPELPLQILGPLGCGLQTGAGAVLNTLNPRAGTSIAIFGVGSVGLAAVMAAVSTGCETIIAVDVQPGRLQQAIQFGATDVIDSTRTDPVAAIRDLTGGQGSHYSVDCIGMPAVVANAVACLQTPGVCATVGFQGLDNVVALNQGHLLFGKSLIGVIEGDAIPGEFIPRLIDLYQAGRFPFDKLIQTVAFEKINDTIDALHRGEVVKAVLTFN